MVRASSGSGVVAEAALGATAEAVGERQASAPRRRNAGVLQEARLPEQQQPLLGGAQVVIGEDRQLTRGGRLGAIGDPNGQRDHGRRADSRFGAVVSQVPIADGRDWLRRCHDQVFDTPPAIVGEPVTSMWRDTNAFNELGIPAISYAPRSQSHATTKSFRIEDLVDAARVYARIAMDLCNQDRPARVPLGAHLNRAIAASVAERDASG